MVLLPCGNCCKPSRCGAIRWDGWVGERAPHGDRAFWFDNQLPYYPQPVPSMPFEFDVGYGTVRVEVSLIRFTITLYNWKFNSFSSGASIVLERSGPHDFLGGELIELTQVVYDSVTPSSRNSPPAQFSGYGYGNAIKTIGTVTLKTSPVAYGQSGECSCICTPRPIDGADYVPQTYTLDFLNLGGMPNGPREVSYDGTSPLAGEPNPGASIYSPFFPWASIFRGPPPTGFRSQVAGCDRYLSRLSSPIVLRRYQQSFAWYSDYIRMNTAEDVAVFVFSRCGQNVGNDMFQSGVPTLECLRYYNGIGSNATRAVATTYDPPCAWNRESYRANIGSYTQFLSQYAYLFGEDGSPFARVIAGGTHSPEGPDFTKATDASSVTVTLTSTEQFPVGGTYNMPLGQAQTGVAFPATDERPALTVSAGLGPGNRTCGCDDPLDVFIGASYGGNFPTGTTWRKSGCYSVYNILDQTLICTNNGKANQSFIFGGYNGLVDCAASATVAFS